MEHVHIEKVLDASQSIKQHFSRHICSCNGLLRSPVQARPLRVGSNPVRSFGFSALVETVNHFATAFKHRQRSAEQPSTSSFGRICRVGNV